MDWRDIPKTVEINHRHWRVRWRKHGDKSWARQSCLGRTSVDGTNVIDLCTRLRHRPELVAEVWLHELGHAIWFSVFEGGRVGDPDRPRKFTRKTEERVVDALTGPLSLVLNQTGWKRS